MDNIIMVSSCSSECWDLLRLLLKMTTTSTSPPVSLLCSPFFCSDGSHAYYPAWWAVNIYCEWRLKSFYYCKLLDDRDHWCLCIPVISGTHWGNMGMRNGWERKTGQHWPGSVLSCCLTKLLRNAKLLNSHKEKMFQRISNAPRAGPSSAITA